MMGIDGIRFYRNPGPGQFWVIEGPDKVGKSTLVTGLAERMKDRKLVKTHQTKFTMVGVQAGIDAYLRTTLVHNDAPAYQKLVDLARLETQRNVSSILSNGIDVLMDRWWPSGLVYGQAAGLELDYLLSGFRHMLVPDLVLIVMREHSLYREGSDAYERDEAFQQNVRKLYYWLVRWWKDKVPTVPIGLVELDNLGCDESLDRLYRRFNQLRKANT
jgi:dTMP kinase